MAEEKEAALGAAEAVPEAVEAVAEAVEEEAESKQSIDERTNEDKTEHDKVVERFSDRFRDFHFRISGACLACSPSWQIGLGCGFAANTKGV
jgi:hypothetical protein